MLKVWTLTGLAMTCAVAPTVTAEDTKTTQVSRSEPELGRVQWERDYAKAVERATRENKPLLVLFTEVPGCATCVNYGGEVLSHPLIVDAAETQFVPVVVRNNVDGVEREILNSFNEPALNNPVVRIINPDRTARSPRVADNFTLAGLANAMRHGLEFEGGDCPGYLIALDDEMRSAGKTKATAVFETECFWEGEAALGGIRGVTSSRTGFVGGKEVVELTFDPSMIDFANLCREGRRLKCATRALTNNATDQATAKRVLGESALLRDEFVESQKDNLYRLMRTPYRGVPMTPVQARRVNTALSRAEDPDKLLSMRQIRYRGLAAEAGDAWPTLAGRNDLAAAFEEAEQAALQLKASGH